MEQASWVPTAKQDTCPLTDALTWEVWRDRGERARLARLDAGKDGPLASSALSFARAAVKVQPPSSS